MTNDLFDLTGEVIIVTGGGGLIGANVCRILDRHGADIVVADLDESRGSKVADQLDRGIFHHLDITDVDSIDRICNKIFDNHGQIDGLVNMAYPRTNDYGKRFEYVEKDDLMANISLHLGGYYAMTKAVALRMVEQNLEGSIVNFSSIYGIQAPDFSMYDQTEMTSPIEYSIIKAGILNFTRYLASYLGQDGIRINSVSPGGVFNDQDQRFVENYEREVPLGRMAKPTEISGAVVYLLSNAASYVTGHNLVVDGGWTIK
ncbi:NAD(P)-dependent dehydrogenase, short-chain alcohol dehydrogenase family [Halorubrum aquaticum]|uniref:NAD(P)-dependent dehydrogenase, short-chain alcohol dehydrogenase family n=1 Tax=Halorubrum aquaticum TaxID=387340 RepID=A0A1I3A5H8_9EURY|nr:oxidoreductase [Halorubrum aquaticum]SFH45258.1 NAD(P)-dependent dehydrogenase, short-chain alcohol dehydrogenase family [Halorubrum aquaticum]